MKNFTKIIALALAIILAFSLAACSTKGGDDSADDSGKVIKIAVPNDTTNEARALLLRPASSSSRTAQASPQPRTTSSRTRTMSRSLKPKPQPSPSFCPTLTTQSSTATTQ